MSTPLKHQVSKRASVPLTTQNLRDLAAISQSQAAPELLGLDTSMSEAAIMHRLFELGVKHAYQVLDEMGYAELAQDPERELFVQTTKARRRG